MTGARVLSRWPVARDLIWCLLATAVVPLIGGCVDGGAGDRNEIGVAASAAELTVRLVIPDGNIREAGASCAGAGAYRFAHPEAPFVVEDDAGVPLSSGTLPHGTAEKAFMLEAGVSRQPTICVMMLEVPGLETVDGHALVIDERSPVPIKVNAELGDQPEVVLP
jgi:hypothetical protein